MVGEAAFTSQPSDRFLLPPCILKAEVLDADLHRLSQLFVSHHLVRQFIFRLIQDVRVPVELARDAYRWCFLVKYIVDSAPNLSDVVITITGQYIYFQVTSA